MCNGGQSGTDARNRHYRQDNSPGEAEGPVGVDTRVRRMWLHVAGSEGNYDVPLMLGHDYAESVSVCYC